MVNLSLASLQEGGSTPHIEARGLAPNDYPNEGYQTLSLPMTRLKTLGLEKISVSKRSSYGSTHMDLSPSTLYHDERHHPHHPTQESFSGATLAAMSDSAAAEGE